MKTWIPDKTYTPGTQIGFCPLCGRTLWATTSFDVGSAGLRFTPPLVLAKRHDGIARKHMRIRHPIRFFLWKGLHWNRLLGV